MKKCKCNVEKLIMMQNEIKDEELQLMEYNLINYSFMSFSLLDD